MVGHLNPGAELVRPHSREREPGEHDLVVQREREPAQHRAHQRQTSGRGDAHDRPASAHQLEAPSRPGGGVHDHVERDVGHGGEHRRDSIDREDPRDHEPAGQQQRCQCHQPERQLAAQPPTCVPRDDVPPRLHEPAERDGKQHTSEAGQRGDQADLQVCPAEARHEHRQERDGSVDHTDQRGLAKRVVEVVAFDRSGVRRGLEVAV